MEDKVKIVADAARDTFSAIKELRKSMPQRTRAQRDELERRIKELQDRWWQDVSPLMVKNENCPPFRKKD